MYKKTILIALSLLIVAASADLAGPLIMKNIIDNHVTGIERPWYVSEQSEDAVQYEGVWYKRSDRFSAGESQGAEVNILQAGTTYYFVNEAISSSDGKREYSDGQLSITRGENVVFYNATPLSKEELYLFYKPEINPIIKLASIFGGLILISALFHYGQRYLLQLAANRIIQKMRTDLFGHLQRLHIQYFDTLPAGKIVSRVTNDTETIRELFVTVLASFVTSFMYIGGALTALFFLDTNLALICLIVVPIIFAWMWMYRTIASKYNHNIRTLISDINANINESIQGMPVIRAFNKQKERQEEFETFNKEHFHFQNKLLNLNAMTGHNLVGTLRNLSFVAVIWYFGGATISSTSIISMGVLYAFIDYLGRIFNPLVEIVNRLPELNQAMVSTERVFQLLDEKGIHVADEKKERIQGNVEFDDVSFSYVNNELVLKHISFEANKGETIALVGHTGSGKSSIMNLLLRFYDAQHGEIRIDGEEIKSIPHQTLRQHLGIVLQDPFLFTGTIASNVSLNDPKITREQVDDALNRIGAAQIFKNLEHGYDEPVLEKGSTLSAGQRQIISFARALAFNPAILVLDEATANIDTETEAIIQHALDVLKEGRTTFIIAHRLSTIKNADKILVLDKGVIVERGNHDELMQQEGKYFNMYQLQKGKKQQQTQENKNKLGSKKKNTKVAVL